MRYFVARCLMNPAHLFALSPLDGRYAAKLAALRPLLSESALMQGRVRVEVEWFIALSDAGLTEFKPLSSAARELLRGLAREFSETDALAIKDIEATTNHDVKAVEYWLKKRAQSHSELAGVAEFVHFACTSEDINNTSYALMLQRARAATLCELPAATPHSDDRAQTFDPASPARDARRWRKDCRADLL